MSIQRKLALGAAAIAMSLAAYSAKAEELKLAHFASTKYPLHVELMTPLSEQIAEKSGGDLTIRIYPGGELGAGPAKQYDRAVDGVADITLALPGYTASQFKKTLLVELPGVVPAGKDVTATFWDNIDEVSKEFRRTKLLALWSNPPGVLMTANKPIRSLEDVKGLKIRVPSKNVGRVAAAWGATPVSMPITEVYNSLATGVIDGVLVDASVLNSFKLKEVANHVTTGMNSTNSPMMLVMNRDSWKDLGEEKQAVLEGLAGATLSEAGRKTQAAGAERALKAFSDMGKEIIELSPEEAAKFNAATDALIEEVVAELESDGVDAGAYVNALRQ
ncbi:TRAP transporter substrate-binding protein [Roseibium sp. MMSF_3544]|uniref:TRAP transporter substrate-binding protein n=1 Tax=unclassified Roseibium TaxID=2629323 RepID=UPI00273E0ECF|nr:TRAP transporter substrate-binding protein [Roseibium sp. MMSF_3544]